MEKEAKKKEGKEFPLSKREREGDTDLHY